MIITKLLQDERIIQGYGCGTLLAGGSQFRLVIAGTKTPDASVFKTKVEFVAVEGSPSNLLKHSGISKHVPQEIPAFKDVQGFPSFNNVMQRYVLFCKLRILTSFFIQSRHPN